MQNSAFEAYVSGRVQMVMFRDFTKRKAESLRLKGEVENQPDGTVRVYAEGDPEKLERLLTFLREGSLFSKVSNVALQYLEPRGGFDGFYIRYN